MKTFNYFDPETLLFEMSFIERFLSLVIFINTYASDT